MTNAEAKRMNERIQRWVEPMVRNNVESRDVIQDVWVALLSKGTFTKSAYADNPDGYLCASVRNAVKEYFRYRSTQKRRPAGLISIDACVATRADLDPNCGNPEAVAIAELYQ